MCVAGAIANFTSQLLHYKHGSADRKCKQSKLSHPNQLFCISACSDHLQLATQTT